MSDQLSFLEERTPRNPSDGLFFALFPPAHSAADIFRVGQQQSGRGLSGRLHAAERLHMSLISLGEHNGLPQRSVDLACEAAATVTFPPFEISFDRVESFFGKAGSYPRVLRRGDGQPQLTAFHQALGFAVKKIGLGTWLKPLDAPHVTLMYADRRTETEAIAPITWTVNEFVLVHSLLGKGQYISLGRRPLRG